MIKFLLVKGNLLSSVTESVGSWKRQEKTVKCPHLHRVNLQALGFR